MLQDTFANSKDQLTNWMGELQKQLSTIFSNVGSASEIAPRLKAMFKGIHDTQKRLFFVLVIAFCTLLVLYKLSRKYPAFKPLYEQTLRTWKHSHDLKDLTRAPFTWNAKKILALSYISYLYMSMYFYVYTLSTSKQHYNTKKPNFGGIMLKLYLNAIHLMAASLVITDTL